MGTIDTVVVGAGHAGLSVSRLLDVAGVDHIVLDRGRVAERWRTERWDSLHLLTPNWMLRLPGWVRGPEANGYLSRDRFVGHLERYAASFGAPVRAGVTVEDVSAAGDGYAVSTDHGTWRARHVVVATGPHGVMRVPAGLRASDVQVIPSNRYRNPGQLPRGGVLVVGASASGVQIADELSRSGRPVVLAVGRHTRLPRTYRGMDIFWWLHETGRLARTIDQVPDPDAARREPSLQLVGRNEGCHDLDLGVLQARGVRLVGRLAGVTGSVARFRDDLRDAVEDAQRRMHRFLDAVDRHVARNGLTAEVLPAVRPRPVLPPPHGPTLDLAAAGMGSIVLATGHRPDFPWLRVDVLDPRGAMLQHRGVSPAPGLYVVGQRFQHRRDSTLIDGARHDARDVVTHLVTGTLPRAAGQQRTAA